MNLCKTLLFLFLLSTNIYSQNDCIDAIVVCGNSGFKGLSIQGAGNVQEITGENSCGSRENNSVWLKISIKTSGTFGFIIKPESSDLNEDFDFFVFGPDAKCTSLTSPIRCSTTNPNMAKLTYNHTGMTADYFDTSEGPAELGDGYIKWINANAGESYFIVIDRPVGISNFSLEWLGTATFDDAPSISVPVLSDLNITKSDFSGQANSSLIFDLTANSPKITGSQTGVKITYHTSENDAIINSNPIADPTAYRNTTSPETIFVRATNTITQCYNTASFTIKINDKVVFPNNKVEVCDENDANPFDGKTKIDFDQVTKVVFDNADVSGLTINYYLTQSDADNNSNQLPNLFNSITPFEQSVFIKAFNSQLSASVAEVKITINPLPPVNNVSLVQCDSGENANGFVLFNLKEANAALTNNNPDLETSFFISKTDAESNTDQLSTEYTNSSNPQTVFARITNLQTKCSSISTVNLKTNVISVQTYLLDIACDDDENEDGIHTFNLTNANIPFTNTQELKYYATENDALLEQNQIQTPSQYNNKVPYNDFVYARIEEGNECFGISKIKLEVIRLPDIEIIGTTTNVCDNDSSYFAQLDAGIKDINTLSDFVYVWKKDGVDILDKTASNIEVNTSGIYTVTVFNKNNCSKTRIIQVVSSNIATIESVEVVDLQIDNSNKIKINVSGSGDYEFSLNTPNGPFQDSNVFENIKSGIYEVYINDKKNCGLVSKTVAVIGVPQFFTPNNDGFNDYWNIIGLNGNEYKNSKIYIYDRYGKLLKQLTTFDNGWDGTFQGIPLPSDDYWYTLKLSDQRESKGHFSLKR